MMKQIPIIFSSVIASAVVLRFDNAYRIHLKHIHQQSSLMQITPYARIKKLNIDSGFFGL